MEFAGTFEQTQSLAADVVKRLASSRLRATPPNLTVWYTYLSGRYPDLVRAMERLIDDGRAISESDCAKLFDTYFGGAKESDLLEGTSDRIEEALNEVVGLLAQATGDAGEYGRSIAGLGSALSDAGAAGQVSSIVKQIVDETHVMQTRTAQLESQLQTSTEEVKLLRQDLADSRHEASTDGLTGIDNRKTFDLRLREEAKVAEDDGTSLSLLLIDIDHFKKFNDLHGHQLGDEVLKLVALELKNNIKGRDTAARYGGEEFATLLPLTALANAATVAEHIRASVAQRRVIKRSSGEALGNITLSIGVAGYRVGEPLGDLIQRADEALYSAKNAGRNRVARELALEPAN